MQRNHPALAVSAALAVLSFLVTLLALTTLAVARAQPNPPPGEFGNCRAYPCNGGCYCLYRYLPPPPPPELPLCEWKCYQYSQGICGEYISTITSACPEPGEVCLGCYEVPP
jgi:hypothetical protein